MTSLNGVGLWLPPFAELTSIVMKALVAVPKSKSAFELACAGIVSLICGWWVVDTSSWTVTTMAKPVAF